MLRPLGRRPYADTLTYADSISDADTLTYADVCWRMLTYAMEKRPVGRRASSSVLERACRCIRWRMLTYADVCWRMLTYADVCSSVLERLLDLYERSSSSVLNSSEKVLYTGVLTQNMFCVCYPPEDRSSCSFAFLLFQIQTSFFRKNERYRNSSLLFPYF